MSEQDMQDAGFSARLEIINAANDLFGTEGESAVVTVQRILESVLGHDVVGGSGNAGWIPDLTKGLRAAGWTIFDDPAHALPGDIAVQNGRGDGGRPGDVANPYENLVGVVMLGPEVSDRPSYRILTTRPGGPFGVYDPSLAFDGFFRGVQAGPPRFYRRPGAADATAPAPKPAPPKPAAPNAGGPSDVDRIRQKIAAAALSRRGMDTSNLAGAGVDACAATVQVVLTAVFGHGFAAGGGDPAWVPDLGKGLRAARWLVIDDAAQAIPGDVGVQNGQGDGGPPGDTASPYENHVGIVVIDPDNGRRAIMNNSSSHHAFINFDTSLQFTNYGYPPHEIGPTRFYRYDG